MFFLVDTDGSGDLQPWEFEEAVNSINPHFTNAEALEIFRDLDVDNSDTLSIEEFMGSYRKCV